MARGVPVLRNGFFGYYGIYYGILRNITEYYGIYYGILQNLLRNIPEFITEYYGNLTSVSCCNTTKRGDALAVPSSSFKGENLFGACMTLDPRVSPKQKVMMHRAWQAWTAERMQPLECHQLDSVSKTKSDDAQGMASMDSRKNAATRLSSVGQSQ